jgi:uncharacterized protein YvpB
MNDIYDRAQKYADEAMHNFSGMNLPEAIRGLIQSQIKLAYTTAFGVAYDQALAGLKALVTARSHDRSRNS